MVKHHIIECIYKYVLWYNYFYKITNKLNEKNVHNINNNNNNMLIILKSLQERRSAVYSKCWGVIFNESIVVNFLNHFTRKTILSKDDDCLPTFLGKLFCININF